MSFSVNSIPYLLCVGLGVWLVVQSLRSKRGEIRGITNLVPRDWYEEAPGYWMRYRLLWGVPFGAVMCALGLFQVRTMLIESPIRLSLLAVLWGALCGTFWGLAMVWLSQRRVNAVLDALYGGLDSVIETPSGYLRQLPCVWSDTKAPGTLFLNRETCRFVAAKSNRTPPAELTIDGFQSAALQLIPSPSHTSLIQRFVEPDTGFSLEIVSGSATMRFEIPKPAETLKKLEEFRSL